MSAAVNVNRTDFFANVAAGWGANPPDWVMVLAEECARGSQTIVARRIGYSGAVVSAVLRRTYAGAMGAVESAVRGALMGEEIVCPILGEMRRDRCLSEQKKNFVGSSEIRTALFRACRSGCAHSRLTRETSDAA